MNHAFARTEMLLGKEAMTKLRESRVAVFGVGGVGTFVIEGLARSGVGKFLLVDDDHICLSNLNRQIHATLKTLGRPKVEVMKERILDIQPLAQVTILQRFYMPREKLSSREPHGLPVANPLMWGEIESLHQEPGGRIDYLVDAIDTVSAKLDLVVHAQKENIAVISSMGTGNKLDPTRLEVADIYQTSVCPLARVMRRELKKRGVEALNVVYSKEEPLTPLAEEEVEEDWPSPGGRVGSKRRALPGSVSFVPSVAGMIIAATVVRDLISGTGLGITPVSHQSKSIAP